MEDSLDTYNMSQGNTQAILGEQGLEYLKETAKWGKFLAIVGFVIVGIIAVASLFIGAIFSNLPQGEMPIPFPSSILTVMYLLMALLYFFPTLYLYQFSTKTLDAIARKEDDLLENGLEKLKSLFKFMGIMTVIVLGFYALGFIVAIVGGIVAG